MKKNTEFSIIYYQESIDWKDETVCAFCGKKDPCKCKVYKKKEE